MKLQQFVNAVWIGGMLLSALHNQWNLFIIMFFIWAGYRFFIEGGRGLK
jgi:hypothetical protein